jgi:hypothetical protein
VKAGMSLVSCGSTGDCCVPRPQGATNMLGLSNGPTCCLYPCPQLPPVPVQLCFTVAAGVQVTISEGCASECLASLEAVVEADSSCNLSWPPSASTIVDSWGRSKRHVSWNRFVAPGSYLRLQFCAVDGCPPPCAPPAGGRIVTPDPYALVPIPEKNSLTKFVVGDVDFVPIIQAAAGRQTVSPPTYGTGSYGCLLKAACVGGNTGHVFNSTSTCCQWYSTDGRNQRVSWGLGVPNTLTYTGAGVADLPVGTEIVIGPIGSVPRVVPTADAVPPPT